MQWVVASVFLVAGPTVFALRGPLARRLTSYYERFLPAGTEADEAERNERVLAIVGVLVVALGLMIVAFSALGTSAA